VNSEPCLGFAVVGYLKNSQTLQLRFYDRTDEIIATEFLSPTRALEVAGKLLKAAHDALRDGIGADQVRKYDT
jgi:hypothetical protein